MSPPRPPSAHAEPHRAGREGWLRAAVLGANDGILSTAGLVVGVAAAEASHAAVITAGVAGVVAGAISMAAGEYVSVSSQRDVERSDLELETRELAIHPDAELAELVAIYEGRGLTPDLARQVAQQLTEHDALEAHARDELGLDEARAARPWQAAWTSALAFMTGAVLPLAAIGLVPGATERFWATIAVTLVALGVLGAVGAALGGAPRARGAGRVVLWGVLAMAVTSVIGALVGAAL